MEQGQLLIGPDASFRRHQLEYVHIVQRPAVARGDEAKLRLAFRQGDIQAFLALLEPLQKKVKPKCGLARSRSPLHQIETVGVEAAAENVVETGKSRRYPLPITKAHGRSPIAIWRSLGGWSNDIMQV